MELVTGDPASMRAAAAQLRVRAETLTDAGAQVDGTVACMTYAGPAADRFRTAVTGHSASLRAVCARMIALADTLVRQAAVVEEQLRTQAATRGAGW